MAKRPMTLVRAGFAQRTLFEGASEPLSPVEPSVKAAPRYFDPSPKALTVGAETLEDYLRRTKQTGVFTIRETVRRSVDLSHFRQSMSGAKGGRPPFHPALLLGLILFAMHRGASSLRAIENLAKSDVCSWWLTGGVAPDHTTLGRFIREHEELLATRIFEELTRAILEKVGASATDLSGDGTTVEAAATRYKKICAESAAAESAELRSQAQAAPPVEAKRLTEKAGRLERAAEVAEERTAKRQKDRGTKKDLEPAKVAPSDPDATYQKLKDGSRAYSYKPVVLANEHRMIVAQTVVSANENSAIDSLCAQAKAVAEAPVDCIRLDAGFFNAPVLTTLLDHEVDDILVSPRAVVEERRKENKKKKNSKPSRFRKEEFKYDADEDAYTCPAGHKLTRQRRGKKLPKRARYSGAPCAGCPLRDQCTKASRGRVIQRTAGDEYFEAMRETMSHKAARRNYVRRAAMVEPVFADLRQIQGLRRFLRRGLDRVQAEFSLHAMAHNLGRLLAVLGPLAAAVWILLRADEAANARRGVHRTNLTPSWPRLAGAA